MNRKTRTLCLAALLLALVAMFGLVPTTPHAAAADTALVNGEAVYIVQLSGTPLANYRGDVEGLAPTHPGTIGERKVDVNSAASVAYLEYLQGVQDTFLADVASTLGRAVDVRYHYQIVFNGVAVVMTAAEAAEVAKLPGVLMVAQETMEVPLTDNGPAWIGAPGVWDGSNTGDLPGTMGEGVIVGVLDTGINLTDNHPSFSDIGGDGYDHDNPLSDYLGVCAGGNTNPFLTCNDKVIGFYTYNGEQPGDSDGHGSHTASTAAGNVATGFIDGTIDVELDISGVAPHANIIAYDVCIASCPSAGLLAAANQATADGVDVINYSISGGGNPYGDAVELAFLNARDAGVFVSASAGNSGPTPGTVAHVSPWVTTVGASTHSRTWLNDLTLTGPGTPPGPLNGRSISAGYGPAPIVHASSEGDALCLTPFPPGTWSGEIVVCDRGTAGRVEKGQNVLAGGAGGYVLANTNAEGESLNADVHVLPAIHIGDAAGDLLRTWLSSGSGHMATISEGTYTLDPVLGDVMAGFSSRGPVNSLPDLIKPDVTAPGVDIFAAYANPIDFNFVSGTSMSSPHNAGAAALMVALYPGWTPAEIQSAMMSTALNSGILKDDGVTPADPFDMGAGRIDLTVAALAGLVLDETLADYQAANPNIGGDPKTLNTASLGDSACAGSCSWTRTFESTLDAAQEYDLSLDLPAGFTGTVTPDNFTIPAGGSQDVTVDINVSGATLNVWHFGQLDITPVGGDVVDQHFPIGIKPTSGGNQPPEIDVDPDSLSATQPPDFQTTQELDISNLGDQDLDWTISEEDTTAGPMAGGWSDNFDSYAVDSGVHGQGGWKGWDNAPAADAFVRDEESLSAPHSLEIAAASDIVHEFSGYSSGEWVVTAWQYIPTGFTGTSYFLLLNTYTDGGPYNWSSQVSFNSASNTVLGEGLSGGSDTIVYDQWVEIRVEIDLDNDTQDFYYDGQLLYSGTWTEEVSGGGALNFAVIDIYANGATPIYYDDLSVQPVSDSVWSDNFDSYANDSQIHGQGGWKGWFNDPAAGAFVRDDQALSAPHSLEIAGPSDVVHEFSGYTSGQWVMTAHQYIPSSLTGMTYFIMQNVYNDGGSGLSWSTQVNFTNGLVTNEGVSGGTLPIVYDEWVEIRVEIDLDNDTQDFYYNGQLLYSGTWTDEVTGDGILNIGALDLFANGASEVYYDDISLSGGGGGGGDCDVPSDITWLSVDPAAGTTPGGGTSTVEVTFDSTGLADGTYTGNLCVESNADNADLVVVPVELVVDVNAAIPDIDVSPDSLSSTLPIDGQETQTLDISNVGSGDLDWTVEEEAPAGDELGKLNGSTLLSTAPPVVNPGLEVSAPVGGAADSPLNPSGVLYDQLDSASTASSSSQEFEAANAAFNNQAADDFVIPEADGAWSIDTVVVMGAYFNGPGPMPFVNVYFYEDNGGLPGTEVASFDGLTSFTDAAGDLTIDLSASPVVLPAGTYWLSVQADMDFTPNGQWGWTDRVVQTGSPAAWRNPGDGFGTGCTDWAARASVCGVGVDPDHLFQLGGTVTEIVVCEPDALPWVSVDPASGTTAPGATSTVNVTFDATGLAAGTYSGNLCIESNDPDESTVYVPVSLTVEEPVPAITLSKTVGTEANVCSTEDTINVPVGTEVTYCYEVTNTGTATLTSHDLVDSELGDLLTGEAYDLAPGASFQFFATATISVDTTNTATWTAYSDGFGNATAEDSATVTVFEEGPEEFLMFLPLIYKGN